MATRLSGADARQSLTEHVTARGAELLTKYGPRIGWPELQRILQDRTAVRYPCDLVFSEVGLRPGEFAHPEPQGETPEQGFTMYVHPIFRETLEDVVPLVLYQLVAVNYGDFASADEAEAFGAAALGLTKDEYYERLCRLADRLGSPAPASDDSACRCGGGCGGN